MWTVHRPVVYVVQSSLRQKEKTRGRAKDQMRPEFILVPPVEQTTISSIL